MLAQDPQIEQMKAHLRHNLESDARQRGKTVQEMLSIITVSHMMEEYDIQLDVEQNGYVEFDSKMLDVRIGLHGYDEQDWRVPIFLLLSAWDFEEEDQSYASGHALTMEATSSVGLHMTWQVTLSLDHVRPADEDGSGYNVYKYHHIVTIRETTPEEYRVAIEDADRVSAEFRRAILGEEDER